jgi:hypothetical protein
MSTAAGLAIAVLAALGAACSFGVGVALQHRQIQRERGHGSLRLLSRLARRRLWLAGLGLAVATSPGLLIVGGAAATGAAIGIMLLGRSPLADPTFSVTRSHV